MDGLRHRDLCTLLSWTRGLYEMKDLDSFPLYALTSIQNAIGADSTIYNEFTLDWRSTYVCSESPDFTRTLNNYNPALVEHASEHPFVSNYSETTRHSVHKISDFISKQQFRRLGIYNDYYHFLGIDHQIAFEIPVADRKHCAYVFNRNRFDFCERDRVMLNLMKPHLIQSYRTLSDQVRYKQILSILERSADCHEEGIVLVTSEGQVEIYNKKAKELLVHYFGWTSGIKELPCGIRDRLQKQLTNGTETSILSIEKEGKRLTINFLHDGTTRSTALLLKEEDDTIRMAKLEKFDLTKREIEVLEWVSRGKTNLEIGIILDLSPRTVQKHLEHIYSKLGVETRTAATAMALGR